MIKYVKNENVIVGIISGCELDAFNMLNKQLPNELRMVECPEYLKLPNEFKGIAKCNPSDTFDEEKGKELAKNRLLKKYNKRLHTALNTYLWGISKVEICGLTEIRDSCETKMNSYTEKVMKLENK